ncbi:MAG: PilZ domain-containing protein [Sphingomonas sp.]|nr:PilZ domain-containing protein [Sphingomonas sp.]
MDQSGVIERRSSRSNVMLQATLEIPGASLPVVLRNLSQDGALVRGEDLPEAGTRVLFHRQGLSVPGHVAWLHSQHAGLSFDEPLFPKEMLRHVPPMGHKPPPVEIKRRPGLAARPLTGAEQRLIEQWASSDSPYTLGD